MGSPRSTPSAVAPIRRGAIDVSRRYYRPKDIVAVTGATKSGVMAAIYSGRLRAHQVGRTWFVPIEAVDEWIRGDAA